MKRTGAGLRARLAAMSTGDKLGWLLLALTAAYVSWHIWLLATGQRP